MISSTLLTTPILQEKCLRLIDFFIFLMRNSVEFSILFFQNSPTFPQSRLIIEDYAL